MYSRMNPGGDEFFVATSERSGENRTSQTGYAENLRAEDPHHIDLRNRDAGLGGEVRGDAIYREPVREPPRAETPRGDSARGAAGFFGSIGGLLEKIGLSELDMGDLLLLLILLLLFFEEGENDFLIIVAVFVLLKL